MAKCIQVLFTGNEPEKYLTDRLKEALGKDTFSLGGLLDITEFAAVIRQAALVVSVNKATSHFAAAGCIGVPHTIANRWKRAVCP